MKSSIIGTAGHVDHGKTSLIKALTGIDADRLKEEKKRGITIELGFASLTTPNGDKVGIVDVPGHEKFIKNMLAGAGGIDVALLVIAADEGIMPQTREHLDILQMLKIERGVIALNKADIVEDEWLEMVALEIEEEVKGSFLQSAEIIPVSAVTGLGVDTLRQHLYSLLAEPSYVGKAEPAPFRIPVDRVFTMDGFGTVVTGTLLEGSLCEDDAITIYPTMRQTKARRIQVFGELADVAYPGQRVAINLAQVKLDEVDRGHVLAPANALENSHIIDVRLNILPTVNREISSNTRVHLYHGTKDLLSRVTLVGAESLKPGQTGFAQLHLAEPIAAKCNDPFVVRFYSPLETIGGGIIIDPCSKKMRNNQDAMERLRTKADGNLSQRIETYIMERPFAAATYIKLRFFNNDAGFDSELAKLVESERIIQVKQNFVHIGYIRQKANVMQGLLSDYHNDNPLQQGMAISEMRSQIFDVYEQDFVDDILNACANIGMVNLVGDRVAHKNFSIKVSLRHQKIGEEILMAFSNGGYSPPMVEEVEENYTKEKKIFRQVFDTLVDSGELIMLTPSIFIHGNFYADAINVFTCKVKADGDITLAQFRDEIGTSRKFAVALLEHFDKKKISKKVGDVRILA